MSDYTSELAMAHVVMRAGNLRSFEDVELLRQQIEYEKRQWEAVVENRQASLDALRHLDSNAGRKPE